MYSDAAVAPRVGLGGSLDVRQHCASRLWHLHIHTRASHLHAPTSSKAVSAVTSEVCDMCGATRKGVSSHHTVLGGYDYGCQHPVLPNSIALPQQAPRAPLEGSSDALPPPRVGSRARSAVTLCASASPHTPLCVADSSRRRPNGDRPRRCTMVALLSDVRRVWTR